MEELLVKVELARAGFQLAVDVTLPAQGVTVLLGPSGSGKSTLLRCLAGLEPVNSGVIRKGLSHWLDTKDGTRVSTQKRRVGFVFQDYALFPHLNVFDNIAYGITEKDRYAKKTTVESWIERLQLENVRRRFPHQLSGGQKQRVALARALAPSPEVLLLDEPFSALDSNLRHAMREQLRLVIEQAQCPVIMVTHDLQDARTLADHIGVMVDGRLTRFGNAAEVINEPKCRVAAELLGWRNFLPITSLTSECVTGQWGSFNLLQDPSPDADCLAVRPEHVRFARQDQQDGITATIETITDLGIYREVRCRLSGGTALYMHCAWDRPVPVSGSEVQLHLPPQYVQLLTNSIRRPSMGSVVKELQSNNKARDVAQIQ